VHSLSDLWFVSLHFTMDWRTILVMVLPSLPEVESTGPGKGFNLDPVKHRILGAETFVSLRNLNAAGPLFIVDPFASRNKWHKPRALWSLLIWIDLILFFCILLPGWVARRASTTMARVMASEGSLWRSKILGLYGVGLSGQTALCTLGSSKEACWSNRF